MSKRSAMAQFEQVARSEISPTGVRPVMPESASPAQPISRTFINQSYFDSTLLAAAILSQRPNEPIVASTAKEEQVSGYAIGLHPSSETPVAIQFKIGGQPTSSQAIILRPGQIIRPHGLPRGVANGSFGGFVWGLPFGWLGGGLATILVFQTPDADASWPGDAEVAFHHARYAIVAPGSLPAAAPKNWPVRFPWTQALAGTGAIIQKGQGAIAISRPSRMIMRLRLTTLAAAAEMRIVFHETNDFDLDSAGAVVATACGFVDFTWPSFAGSGGAGNLAVQYPYYEIAGPAIRLGADDGGIQLVDISGAASLAGAYVDITRYGFI